MIIRMIASPELAGKQPYQPDTHINIYTPGTGHPAEVWDPIRPAFPNGVNLDIPINFDPDSIQKTAGKLLDYSTIMGGSASLGAHMQLLIVKSMEEQALAADRPLPEIGMVTIDPYLGKDHITKAEQVRMERLRSKPTVIGALARMASQRYGLAREKVQQQMEFIAHGPTEGLQLPHTLTGIRRILAIRSLQDKVISDSAFEYLRAKTSEYRQEKIEADHAQLPEHPERYADAIAAYVMSIFKRR